MEDLLQADALDSDWVHDKFEDNTDCAFNTLVFCNVFSSPFAFCQPARIVAITVLDVIAFLPNLNNSKTSVLAGLITVRKELTCSHRAKLRVDNLHYDLTEEDLEV